MWAGPPEAPQMHPRRILDIGVGGGNLIWSDGAYEHVRTLRSIVTAARGSQISADEI